MTTIYKTTFWCEVMEMKADFSQASDEILIETSEPSNRSEYPKWSSTPWQVASFGHDPKEAMRAAIMHAFVLENKNGELDAELDEAIENMESREEYVSLLDYNNDGPITYLWYCGIGCPDGVELSHDVDTDDDEEYCDFAELDIPDSFLNLDGKIDNQGRWQWSGIGDPVDERRNTITAIIASR